MNPRKTPERPLSGHKYADLSKQIRLHGDEPVFDGNYSKVYKGDLNGKMVAIKVLKFLPDKNNDAMERKMEREMTFWAEQKHKFIAEFLGQAQGPKFQPLGALISPWYKYGDSHTYLEAKKEELTFWKRISLFVSVVNGLKFLHRKGIVHGDIKPGNVLIDEKGNPKICDFGLARLFLDAPSSGLTTTSEFTGTPRFLAPELLTSDSTPPTTASDVWALGCLGLVYLCQVQPYAHRPNNNRGGIYQDIKKGMIPCEKTMKVGLDDAVQELLHMCWHRDHTRRPGLVDISKLTSLVVGNMQFFFDGVGTAQSGVTIYEMAHIRRHIDEKWSKSTQFFVRPSPESRLRLHGRLALQYEDWRQWALLLVLPDNDYRRDYWKVVEVYTGLEEVLLNPEDATIVTFASVSRKYDAMRSRGESPFPILPVTEWPLHGEGSIIEPSWRKALGLNRQNSAASLTTGEIQGHLDGPRLV